MDELFTINCGNTSDYVFHTDNSNLGTKPFLHWKHFSHRLQMEILLIKHVANIKNVITIIISCEYFQNFIAVLTIANYLFSSETYVLRIFNKPQCL